MRFTVSSDRWSGFIPTSRPWSWRARGPRESADTPDREAQSAGLGGGRLGKRLILLFRPGDVVGDDGHDRYSRHADENLREQRARTQHQPEMSEKGENKADEQQRH